MNRFTLARMRHLDLLALWLGPDGHERSQMPVGRMSKDWLASAIIAAWSPRP